MNKRNTVIRSNKQKQHIYSRKLKYIFRNKNKRYIYLFHRNMVSHKQKYNHEFRRGFYHWRRCYRNLGGSKMQLRYITLCQFCIGNKIYQQRVLLQNTEGNTGVFFCIKVFYIKAFLYISLAQSLKLSPIYLDFCVSPS